MRSPADLSQASVCRGEWVSKLFQRFAFLELFAFLDIISPLYVLKLSPVHYHIMSRFRSPSHQMLWSIQRWAPTSQRPYHVSTQTGWAGAMPMPCDPTSPRPLHHAAQTV